MRKQAYIFFVGIIISILIVGVNPGVDVEANANQLEALVTIPPQAFLVNKIAGDRFTVSSMVLEGGSPHSASITPKKMITIRNADIYFKVGTPTSFEVNNLPVFRQENPDMLVKDTSEGIELKSFDEHYSKTKPASSTGSEDKAVDPHIWLSPANLKEMSKNVYQGLKEIDPQSAEFYKNNLETLLKRISEVQGEANSILGKYEGRSFLAYHSAWGYFGDEFKLLQVEIQEGGDKPGPQKIREITKFAQRNGIETIIASAQFSPKTAKKVADIFGGKVVSINPMEKEILEEIVKLAKGIARGYSNG